MVTVVVHAAPRYLGSSGWLGVDVCEAAVYQVRCAGQSECHVGPGPHFVRDRVVTGVGLAAEEDPVVVQAEQLAGVELEPWRCAGGVLGEPGPGSEMPAVLEPG